MKLLTVSPFTVSPVKSSVLSSALVLLFLLETTFYTHTELQFFFRVLVFRFFDNHSTILKGKVHPCTGTEALYRPYSP